MDDVSHIKTTETPAYPFATKELADEHNNKTLFEKIFTKENLLCAGFVIAGSALCVALLPTITFQAATIGIIDILRLDPLLDIFINKNISGLITAVTANPTMFGAVSGTALAAGGLALGALFNRGTKSVLGAIGNSLLAGAGGLALAGLAGAGLATAATFGAAAAGGMAGYQIFKGVSSLFKFAGDETTKPNSVEPQKLLNEPEKEKSWLDSSYIIPALKIAGILAVGYMAYSGGLSGLASTFFDLKTLPAYLKLGMLDSLKWILGYTTNPAFIAASVAAGIGIVAKTTEYSYKLFRHITPLAVVGGAGALLAGTALGVAAAPIGFVAGATAAVLMPSLFHSAKEGVTSSLSPKRPAAIEAKVSAPTLPPPA